MSIFVPRALLDAIPRTITVVPTLDEIAYLHFSLHRQHWYVTEFDGAHTFFGVVFDARANETIEYFTVAELERKQQTLSVITSGPPPRTQTLVAKVQWQREFEPTCVRVIREQHRKARG